MILYDEQIREEGAAFISPFDSDAVQSIAYDLHADGFTNEPGNKKEEFWLNPGESVFVITKELIEFPPNIVGRVILRNSRIRQGLDLVAPVYYPGHKTKIYFRITNMSKKMISLNKEDGIASIMFEKLDGTPSPYEGTFQEELDFKGMGDYTSHLADGMIDIEKKVDQVNSIEKTIYGNVLAIMAIFVGIFSLINVNLQNLTNGIKNMISLDLTTVGSIGFLVAIINTILPAGRKRGFVWGICGVAFAVAIILLYI